eukprot:UN13060
MFIYIRECFDYTEVNLFLAKSLASSIWKHCYSNSWRNKLKQE